VAALLALGGGLYLFQGLPGLPPEAPRGDDPELQEPRLRTGERIRVEVLNAGGRRDMARIATERLRAAGFDVVYYGNSDRRFASDSSVVLVRMGPPRPGEEVAETLRIPTVRVEPDSTRLVEVTVRLGAEWEPDSSRVGGGGAAGGGGGERGVEGRRFTSRDGATRTVAGQER